MSPLTISPTQFFCANCVMDSHVESRVKAAPQEQTKIANLQDQKLAR